MIFQRGDELILAWLFAAVGRLRFLIGALDAKQRLGHFVGSVNRLQQILVGVSLFEPAIEFRVGREWTVRATRADDGAVGHLR